MAKNKNILSREGAAEQRGNGSGQTATREQIAGMMAKRVNPMAVAAVFRCVNHLSNSVANLPVMFMRRRGDIFTPDTDSRLNYLLNVQPSGDLNAVDFWRQLVQYVYLRGNAYAVPEWDPVALDWARLVLVNPDSVAHDTVNDTYTIYDAASGIQGTYDESEIIHVKNYTRDGKRGISTLEFARIAVDTAAAGDAETKERNQNGGNVRGIVSNGATSVRGFGEYQDSELERTAADLDGQFRDGKHIVALPGQAEFSPITLSAIDMQFLGTRKFTVLEICRFFGVNPAFVFEDSGSNYKTAEAAKAAYLSNTLSPLLRKIENEFQRKLIPAELNGRQKIEFDRRAVFSMDPDSRAKYQAATLAAGIYTVNDWRRSENRPDVPDGDTVLISANLKRLSDAAARPVSGKPGKVTK